MSKIDVDGIMKEIRAEIAEDQAMAEIPPFEKEVAVQPGLVPVSTDELQRAVEQVCLSHEVPVSYPLPGGKVQVFFRKILRKLVRPTVWPVVNTQNVWNRAAAMAIKGLSDKQNAMQQEMDQLREELAASRADLASTQQELVSTEQDLAAARREQEALGRSLGAAARDLQRAKWQLRDYLGSLKEDGDRVITCGICGHAAPVKTYEIKETDCIFAGGHLVRFVCPECGCIFGPLKFSDQTQEEFDDDYVVNYAGFHESDATYKERYAFEQLQPVKTGVYLNYGCGSWSHTINELRAEGYQVYGYEPYAPDVNNEYIITDREQLTHMRFDGIFSNDLLEHLRDPVAEIAFMKSLLATPESRMSHCTGCFLYRYEYTRFHTYFFTGDSVRVMADRAGLVVTGHTIEPQSQDPNYTFGVRIADSDELSRMITTGTKSEHGSLTATPGTLICGPYLSLPAATYPFYLTVTLPPDLEEITCTATADRGQRILQEYRLSTGDNLCELTLSEWTGDVEFVIRNERPEGDVRLTGIAIRWPV